VNSTVKQKSQRARVNMPYFVVVGIQITLINHILLFNVMLIERSDIDVEEATQFQITVASFYDDVVVFCRGRGFVVTVRIVMML
jgi:hypothetical protein